MIEKSRFFDIFGKNMGFDLIFAKNQIDHQNLRKKLRHFKKKDFHFDRFLAIFRSKQNVGRSKITIIFQLQTPKYSIQLDFRKKPLRPSNSTQKMGRI